MPASLSFSATPVATYRLQMRGGVDLAAAQDLLPWLVQLGVSHLYLSPILAATPGSSHGYDVTDPTRVDPALGGDAAFEVLAEAGHKAGIGLVLDIVPNHMALSPHNPMLADVLRLGQDSEFAAVFDIDWSLGRLHLPVLDRPVIDLLTDGHLDITQDGCGRPALRVHDDVWPLNPTKLAEAIASGAHRLTPDSLNDLLAQQHWSLGHWKNSSDRIIHRRFFNITSLIGVRQEAPDVFARTHNWLFKQVAAGRIAGVRVDHVDGLAHPCGYLTQLRCGLDEAAGKRDAIPIWVEKIVKAEEAMPSWPVAGMSGYEFIAPLTRLLLNGPVRENESAAHCGSDGQGLAALRRAAQGSGALEVTPSTTAWHKSVRDVRHTLLAQMFAPERARTVRAAQIALAAPDTRPSLEKDIVDLASIWPVYRTYASDGCVPGPLCAETLRTFLAQNPGSPLIELLQAPHGAQGYAFCARFEQLTGALTAKSEEDTLYYRAIACLPLCEVGAGPQLGPLDARAFTAAMQKRASKEPLALSPLSTHDTKRSGDARAAMIAMAWSPGLSARILAEARSAARMEGLEEYLGIYAAQCALAMHGQDDGAARIAAHMVKALREGKALSSHETPNEDIEARAARLACDLLHGLETHRLWSRCEADAFGALHSSLVLAQVALQLTAPGVPDIYQGSEVVEIALTDPDNRRTVDFGSIHARFGTTSEHDQLGARKLALTRTLLDRRRKDPELFTHGAYRLDTTSDHWTVTRSLGKRIATITINMPSTILQGSVEAQGRVISTASDLTAPGPPG